MAYTTPTTRSTDDLVTALIWNTDIVDNIVYLKSERDQAIDASPVGQMSMWPTNTAPTDWLLCDGSAVSRSTYSDLFGVIGTTFGVGDGSTTFNLPDMRGRVPLGQDDMGGASANVLTDAAADTIGGTGGSETHTLTTAELASHDHDISARTSTHSPPGFPSMGSTVNSATGTTQSEGSGDAHANVQPYLTLNFIIYAGV